MSGTEGKSEDVVFPRFRSGFGLAAVKRGRRFFQGEGKFDRVSGVRTVVTPVFSGDASLEEGFGKQGGTAGKTFEGGKKGGVESRPVEVAAGVEFSPEAGDVLVPHDSRRVLQYRVCGEQRTKQGLQESIWGTENPRRPRGR